jgi:hypothetical protein
MVAILLITLVSQSILPIVTTRSLILKISYSHELDNLIGVIGGFDFEAGFENLYYLDLYN